MQRRVTLDVWHDEYQGIKYQLNIFDMLLDTREMEGINKAIDALIQTVDIPDDE